MPIDDKKHAKKANIALGVFFLTVLLSLIGHLGAFWGLGLYARLLEILEARETRQQSAQNEDARQDDVAWLDAEEIAQLIPQHIDERSDDQVVDDRTLDEEEEEETPPEEDVSDAELQEVKETNAQAIDQTSQNPNDPPPDTQFIAEENNTVEEETVARIRAYDRNDIKTDPGKTQEKSDAPDPGNADSEQGGDATDKESDDHSEGDLDRAPLSKEQKQAASQAAAAGDRPAAQDYVVLDGPFGKIRVPRARGGGKNRRGRVKANPRLTWSDFEKIVGKKKLASERAAYRRRRKARSRGRQYGKDFKEFRAAMENFTPHVKPGNQTALNARANKFAAYIARVHVQIHREFADKFLAGLPTWDSSPLADESLNTTLEIVFDKRGRIADLGVLKTSGLMAFDLGAYQSVKNAGPFPKPPKSIRSPDGRVYMHWGFYRSARQCGTFNAQAFILKGRKKKKGPIDTPERKKKKERARPNRTRARSKNIGYSDLSLRPMAALLLLKNARHWFSKGFGIVVPPYPRTQIRRHL